MYNGEEIFNLLVKCHQKNFEDMRDWEREGLKFFFTFVVNFTDPEYWNPIKRIGVRSYCHVVSESDEVLGLWLLHYNGEKPVSAVERVRRHDGGGRRRQLRGEEMERSKQWMSDKAMKLETIRMAQSEEDKEEINQWIAELVNVVSLDEEGSSASSVEGEVEMSDEESSGVIGGVYSGNFVAREDY